MVWKRKKKTCCHTTIEISVDKNDRKNQIQLNGAFKEKYNKARSKRKQ